MRLTFRLTAVCCTYKYRWPKMQTKCDLQVQFTYLEISFKFKVLFGFQFTNEFK